MAEMWSAGTGSGTEPGERAGAGGRGLDGPLRMPPFLLRSLRSRGEGISDGNYHCCMGMKVTGDINTRGAGRGAAEASSFREGVFAPLDPSGRG